jgi:amidophosphoribosyltransferase
MIGADSLKFLTEDEMMLATGGKNNFCKACFDGDYPMEVPIEGSKMQFEKME